MVNAIPAEQVSTGSSHWFLCPLHADVALVLLFHPSHLLLYLDKDNGIDDITVDWDMSLNKQYKFKTIILFKFNE